MITARRAFSGATGYDTIAAVVEPEPDWSALPACRRACDSCCSAVSRRMSPRRLRDIGEARQGLPTRVGWPMLAVARNRADASARPLYAVAALAVLGVLAIIAVTLFNTRQAPAPNPSPTEYIPDPRTSPIRRRRQVCHPGRAHGDVHPRWTRPFSASGQIYVKLLPNGEAVQLTTGKRQEVWAGLYTRRFAGRVHRAHCRHEFVGHAYGPRARWPIDPCCCPTHPASPGSETGRSSSPRSRESVFIWAS